MCDGCALMRGLLDNYQVSALARPALLRKPSRDECAIAIIVGLSAYRRGLSARRRRPIKSPI